MKIIKNPSSIYGSSITILFCLVLLACVPKEQIVFKGVKDIAVDMSDSGKPVLRAEVYFFNPNKVRMKLKEVNVEVSVDGSKSADVKHELDVTIGGESNFSVPIVAQLSLKQTNLLDAVVGLLGGKKYEVIFTGYIRVRVHGVTIKIPVSQKHELKLNI
jgi:LEA14-like dessication related protein